MKRALCIGINYYNTPIQIKSCNNDAKLYVDMLEKTFGYHKDNISLLLDSNGFASPTYDNIIKSLRWLIDSCSPGDKLFFSFSGHSGATTGIYTVDKQWIDASVIQQELLQNVPKDVSLVCVFDCNHSGTLCGLPIVIEGPSKVIYKAHGVKYAGSIVTFSSCKHSQICQDGKFGGRFAYDEDKLDLQWGNVNGAFTWHFTKVMRQTTSNHSIKDVFANVHVLLSKNYRNQNPVLSVSDEVLLEKNVKYLI